ncbi:IS110 family transposase [Kribbella speibonae]|uniref:IS110 family transposase n=2 Tax=Kribbella speibonae TaxID=1572660 RepID=A0ABY1ZV16_9ACTN|nr:IS110 family transposase [Kribbella speibonae]TCC15406.1 IS110 family transposase [Kribbella speibonae]
MPRTDLEPALEITGGVDTHRDTHTAAAVDQTGRMLGHAVFDTTRAGYAAVLAWLRSFGSVVLVGVEGTGAYGSGLTSYLTDQGVTVVEIDRPSRKTRRTAAKSDPIDAEAAARAALGKVRTGTPKTRNGQVEALRNLRIARTSAVDESADCLRQIKALLVTAPHDLRDRFRGLTNTRLIHSCLNLRPDPGQIATTGQAAKTALRSLARRYTNARQEITELDQLITGLIETINPTLLNLHGVGPDIAGQLLVTAGQNPERIRSEAAFAMLCGVAPIPASSGQTHRHRLNRGGDRQANKALYLIVISRLRWDPRTHAYVKKRTTEGLSKKDIIRCLKRLIAREIYYTLRQTQPTPNPQPTPA